MASFFLIFIFVGMLKTYQLANDGPFGSSKKVTPMTTEEVRNQMNCFAASGDEDDPVEPQSVVPDLTNFKVFISIEIICSFSY